MSLLLAPDVLRIRLTPTFESMQELTFLVCIQPYHCEVIGPHARDRHRRLYLFASDST